MERLERVSQEHTALALSLYRHPRALRHLLRCTTVPEGAPRVAISLQDPVDGPFIVVTRDGAFVTCLGEGMGTGGLPVISRQELDHRMAEAELAEARAEASRESLGDDDILGQLYERLFVKADDMSREVFQGLAALEPLIRGRLLDFYLRVSTIFLDRRAQLLPSLRRLQRKVSRRDRKPLQDLWRSAWAVGNLAALLGLGAQRTGALFAKLLRSHEAPPFVWPALRTGIHSTLVRSLWAAGQMGQAHLDASKEGYAEAITRDQLLAHGHTLGAIALRHPIHRPSIRHFIANTRPAAAVARSPKDAAYTDWFGHLVDLFRTIYKSILDAPELFVEVYTSTATKAASELAAREDLEQLSQYGPDNPLPDTIAMALPVCSGAVLAADDGALCTEVALAMAWVSGAMPEDLFLPEEFMRAFRRPWRPDDSLRLLAAYRDAEGGLPQPVRKKPRPGRNDRCPCGSGKKYKKCCLG